MAKEDYDNDLLKWCVEQVIKMHNGSGLTVEAITAEAKKLYEFVTQGDKE